ncbi:MAG: hypothetical protein KJN85_11285, partial [Maribacter sp.]|nr:hypothetical protein [Maribacter sp.]NNK18725.1 hypothetical protein [Maribacter sp.]
IKQKGFSRIPVYDRNQSRIKGILYTKDLIGVIESDERTIEEFYSEALCPKRRGQRSEGNVRNGMSKHFSIMSHKTGINETIKRDREWDTSPLAYY